MSATYSFEKRLISLGGSLTASIDALLEPTVQSRPPLRPSQLDAATGIGKDTASRILQATRAADPLMALHLLPGPVPLRRLLQVASSKQIPIEILDNARHWIDEFDRFIRAEAGDRATLDLILSGWLPDARLKSELLAKQAVYKGVSQIKGITADVVLESVVMFPSTSNPAKLDVAAIHGVFGYRRWRRDAVLRFLNRRLDSPSTEVLEHSPFSSLTLDGGAINCLDDILLKEFSNLPESTLEKHRGTHNEDVFHVQSDTLGMQSAADVVVADLLKGFLSHSRPTNQPRKGGISAGIEVPTKLLILDILLPKNVFATSEPQLCLWDTCMLGMADFNDPHRQNDVLPLTERVDSAGMGINGLRLSEVPGYLDMLRMVFGQLKISDREFRAYRCRIEYPMYTSQVAMMFEMSPASS